MPGGMRITVKRNMRTIYPGNPYPLGSYWDGKGVNFALYSYHATAVKLCLFNKEKGEIIIKLFLINIKKSLIEPKKK